VSGQQSKGKTWRGIKGKWQRPGSIEGIEGTGRLEGGSDKKSIHNETQKEESATHGHKNGQGNNLLRLQEGNLTYQKV